MRPPKPYLNREFIKTKPKLRSERMSSFIQLYKDSREEYNEDNTPTALHNIFKEFLLSLPKEDLNMCNTKSLFEEALTSIIGDKKTFI